MKETFKIELPEEVADYIDNEINAGRFLTYSDFIVHAVREWMESEKK